MTATVTVYGTTDAWCLGCELRTANSAGAGGRFIVVAQTENTLTIKSSTWWRRLYWRVRRWFS